MIASILSKFVDFENYPDFHLYSNEINFDEKGYLSSFKQPYLHFTDKGEVNPWDMAWCTNFSFIRYLVKIDNIIKMFF